MALHKPPLEIPFINMNTGHVTEPWAKWLIITQRDKANRVEDGTVNNIATLDGDGHPQDGEKALPDGNFVGVTDTQELANKTFAELVSTRVLASDGSSGLQEIDLSSWIDGTAGKITVTDDGDGTVTLNITLKAGFGITFDADGLQLVQQTNITDASNISAVALTAGADSIDLTASNATLSTMRTEINALKTKINAILALLLAAEMMAGP